MFRRGTAQLLQRERFRIAAGMQTDIDARHRRQSKFSVQPLQLGR